MEAKRVLVIGLGQIGYSNAEYMSSKGIEVDGYDISEKAVKRALDNNVIRSRAKSFHDYDYYVICISTHKPDNMFIPYLDGLYDIARRISYEGKTGALVGIDSTVTRGTCNRVKEILNHRLHVSHVPHRYYVNEAKEHGVRQTRVLAGCEPCCTREARHFYGHMLDIPLHVVSSIDIAELSKVVENSYRFVEIAFAEELKMICDGYGIDFNELRTAVNTKWNIKILEARDGIGGHCLPKDSQMFLSLSSNVLESSIVEAAKLIDYKYRAHIGQKATQIMSLRSEGSEL
ncbi:MAG: NAD(P)-binding domain-containing protein [Nitrososphaerales archaeon]